MGARVAHQPPTVPGVCGGPGPSVHSRDRGGGGGGGGRSEERRVGKEC